MNGIKSTTTTTNMTEKDRFDQDRIVYWEP